MLIYGYDFQGFYMGNQTIGDNEEIPNNATKIKPPNLGEHQMLVFENNDWRIKNDYRNVTACQVDENSVFISPYVFILGEVPSERTILTSAPLENNFYQVKWNGTTWVEGLTQEEIDLVLLNTAKSPLEAALTIAELNSRIDILQGNLQASNATTTEFISFAMSSIQAQDATLQEFMAFTMSQIEAMNVTIQEVMTAIAPQ